MSKTLNGWQVSIEVFFECSDEENKNIVSSPLFNTEAEADAWYRALDFSFTNKAYAEHLDIIMVHYVDNKIEDTYVF